ncbi:hypothetical protein BCR44DRAFT_1428613 [Catenaria anguillulae PL171]|uniref:Uncharacterized protein n=1 Tax=Catenaria anguillulae PL171 TaxID=765915 RepID=A0A1Y2HZN2_9FUNG|nr:hypothetical protein BCR44DRAFT_1428613 [Catenaria anguillulae PL171]
MMRCAEALAAGGKGRYRRNPGTPLGQRPGPSRETNRRRANAGSVGREQPVTVGYRRRTGDCGQWIGASGHVQKT